MAWGINTKILFSIKKRDRTELFMLCPISFLVSYYRKFLNLFNCFDALYTRIQKMLKIFSPNPNLFPNFYSRNFFAFVKPYYSRYANS